MNFIIYLHFSFSLFNIYTQLNLAKIMNTTFFPFRNNKLFFMLFNFI